MAFIMLASNAVKSALIMGLVILLLPFSQSMSAPFEVTDAYVKKIGNGYSLYADIKYPLTPRVKEALENGVPITFFQEIEFVEIYSLIDSYWQWEDVIWSSKIRYQLRYHALTKQYIVNALDTNNYLTFISLNEALSSIGHISSLTLPANYLHNSTNITVRLRSGIDIFALPTPMRPGALVSKKWQVTSDWANAIWR